MGLSVIGIGGNRPGGKKPVDILQHDGSFLELEREILRV